jgi:hypothetical protein
MRRGDRILAGTLLLLAAAALLVLAAWLLWAPLEEPATLGRTPNPSRAPWAYDPASWNEMHRRATLQRRLILYVLPAACLGLAALGVLVLAGGDRAK